MSDDREALLALAERVELLPCPFCGGDPVDWGDHRASKIGCRSNDCEASTGPWWSNEDGSGLARAIERWNTRALAGEQP